MPLDIDQFIERHLHLSSFKQSSNVAYSTEELHELAKMSIQTFSNESSLARINPPCTVVGDIHGQFVDLLRMFAMYTKENGNKEGNGCLAQKFVFLGDYIDRGKNSLECLVLVLSLKVKHPSKYIVLRGNHECIAINRVYGFYDELVGRFGSDDADKIFDAFNEVFAWMPLAGLVGRQILCMHGGISPELTSLRAIEKIQRPLMDAAQNKLALDLIWSDPGMDMIGFRPNTMRGVSVFFGEDEVRRVCRQLDIKMIVRGHQVMNTGFGTFANRKLLTIFTAPRYDATAPNAGATLDIAESGMVGMRILRPLGGEGKNVEEEALTRYISFEEDNKKKNGKKKLPLRKKSTPTAP